MSDVSHLRAKWGWTTLLALPPLGIMIWLDTLPKKMTGLGILDLQFAGSAAKAARILNAWRAAGLEPQFGFSLGIDYLHMFLYSFALFYGAIAAREAFAKERGALRSFLSLAAWAGTVAALLDAVENAIHAGMLFGMVSFDAVALQYPVTMGKWTLLAFGVLLSLAGLVGLVTGRLKT